MDDRIVIGIVSAVGGTMLPELLRFLLGVRAARTADRAAEADVGIKTSNNVLDQTFRLLERVTQERNEKEALLAVERDSHTTCRINFQRALDKLRDHDIEFNHEEQ